jgi:GT2 family glycosyltransferase/glycosyltransferase involved in cell wall biosynthesis
MKPGDLPSGDPRPGSRHASPNPLMITQSKASSAIAYAIDSPGALQAPEGFLQLSGWLAGESVASAQVRLRLGPTSLFDCRTGEARPDVLAVHPDLSGAAESGFRLETYVPPGFHVGTFEYRMVGQSDWIPFHTLSIIAGLSPLFAQLECEPPTEHTQDWYVRGWCFHPQCAIESVTVQFAHKQAVLKHGEQRPDVASVHPQYHSALNSGFAGYFSVEPGQAPVNLKVKLSNGSVVQKIMLPALTIQDRDLERAQQLASLIRAAQIKLATPAQPDVSIIIPIYNQLDFTLGCLESLVRHAGETSFEVIIINDRSEGYVAETLSSVSGLRLHSNEKNQGFVLNCNRGADMAHGEYVLFLNNDTEVTEGWLEALLQVFRQRPKAGAVGAKLIYPNGRLQEAGGIIAEDGSGWNYGRNDDPDRPEYNYLRQVDYCSGACLLVPRELFLGVGGFDTIYQPAYYEDTDLAFKLRAAGREVYYQPAAKIIHYEGVSSGTDVSTGVKRHQAVNREKFAAKWAAVLPHYNADPSLIHVARDRHAPCRILVIDACALTPDADSGSLRMFNLLLMLAQHGAKVTFAATNLQSYEPYSTQLRLEGVEHLGAPHTHHLGEYLKAKAHVFDVIVLSRKCVAQELIAGVRKAAPATRIVFDTVDLMYLRLERQAELEGSAARRAEAARSKVIELELCANADLVFVVSPVEAELLSQHLPPGKIALVSNIHALYPSKTNISHRRGLMFVGGFQHPPNVDAVEFFLDEVLPLVVRRLPDLEVHIVGSNMPASLQARGGDHVHMHGYVPELDELYARIRLTIAPLRYGAGVKGKVNQSMAHGVPVVATTAASEGMYLVHEHDVLIADDAVAFAHAIIRLHEDEALWLRISQEGTRNIENHFSFAAVKRELFRSLGASLFSRRGTERPLPSRPAAPYQPGRAISCGRDGALKDYTRQGWAKPEENSCWIIGGKASLEFQLPPSFRPTKVSAVVYPFLAPPALKQQRLLLQSQSGGGLEELTVCSPAAPTRVEWQLTEREVPGGKLFLTFLCPDATAPLQLGASADTRKLSFAFIELSVS